MKTLNRIWTFEILLAFLLIGCGSTAQETGAQVGDNGGADGLGLIANQVANGVGAIGQISKDGAGASIFIFEELHNSRAGQVQQAIMLHRLYEKHGLRDLALEGYLRERPKMNPAWFARAAPGETSLDRARVAVRLLKEGEISASEFMKLTFEDFDIHRTESIESYEAELTSGAIPALEELAKKIDPKLGRDVTEMLEGAVSGKKEVRTNEQLALAEDLERRRVAKKISMTPDQVRDWHDWLEFWRARAKADPMMVDATVSNSSGNNARLIAMVIGRAHTDEVTKLIGEKGRAYAVLAAQVLKDRDLRGDLHETYDRKMKRQSVFSEGIFATAVNAFESKKPEPVIAKPEAWIEAKAAIYRTIDAVASAALGSSNPPPGGKPPFGLSDGDFGSRLVRPILASAEIIEHEDPRKKAVVFPIVLNPDNPGSRSTLWVKAVLGQSQESGVVSIEDMLKEALAEVQGETTESKRTEDANGRIRVSTRTSAGIARTKAAARAMQISS